MDQHEAKEKIKNLAGAIVKIDNQASDQNRSLTQQEHGLVAEMQGSIQELSKYLPDSPQTVALNQKLTGSGSLSLLPSNGYQPIKPGDSKSWKNLFGSTGPEWADKETGFFQAVMSGRHHEGLKIKNAMSESVPSDGGWLCPTEYSEKIHNVALESEIIMPRAWVIPMRGNEIHLPGMQIGSHANGVLMGGFVAHFGDEAQTINEASPKVRELILKTKKLTGLIRYTSEMMEDMVGGEEQILRLCGTGLGFTRDCSFISGSGSGEPMGFLNSPCLVVVDKESGQSNGVILYENLTKMLSRLYTGSFSNSLWICHSTTIPMLLSLSISIGLAGQHVPVLKESNGAFSILTRPCIFSEKMNILGEQGDIALVDLSQYVIGLRNEIRFDISAHVHFETDELIAKIRQRFDGQTLWDEVLTLKDGSTEVSPFVTLAAR